MSKLLKSEVLEAGRYCLVTLAIVLSAMLGVNKAAADCGCLDLVLVVDDSGSMGGAQSNVKSALPMIISSAQAASGSDLRIAIVSFPNVAGSTNDGVTVRQAFTTDTSLINNAVQALTATGGNGEPESSDAALQYVVTGTTDTGCIVSNAPLGSFRPECAKIAAVFTDAHPGGCDDTYTPGVDDVHADLVAKEAGAAGIQIASIYIPTSGETPDIKQIMEDYATQSGGTFFETSSDGTGTGQAIVDIITSLITPSTNSVGATRNARFWFKHGYSLSDCACATLLKAIQLNGGDIDLGFISLPTRNRNADTVTDSYDTLMEALSFYWLKTNKSKLCEARKHLAVQLMAAIANTKLLHTNPSDQTYFNGVTTVNFPPDLLQQARTAAGTEDVRSINTSKALLRKFNRSGVTNNFPVGLVECSAKRGTQLRGISVDPTTQSTCPQSGNTCAFAESVVFPTGNPFARAVYSSSASTFEAVDSVPSPTCGTGGRDAVWQIKPTTVGTTGRHFTVSTDGSNFDTMISIWSGDTCSNLTQVACTNGVIGVGGEQLGFTTDGTNTYRIVVEGPTGNYGAIKIKITSP
ncbi:MAG TPA: vWA domain-containing protein [Verrucomicrobiae bacterium]|nr:vWA domain-containing protein [Verrucomicrobiae bacterium]